MRNRRPHAGTAVVLALLLSSCAGSAGSAGSAGDGPAAAPSPEGQPDQATVVLQVSEVGGFTTPALLAGRVPGVTVYADGRVITDGPVAAVWPAPALPNLQLHRLDDGGVRDLVEHAVAAGATGTTDLGSPPIADATTTRFLVRTGGATVTREVYALGLGLGDAGPGRQWDPGLTQEQVAARARLAELVEALRNPAEILGAGRVTGPETYRSEAVAALVSPYVEPVPDPAQPAEPWPGPPLPGEAVAPGVTCVTATGEQADAVLAAAADASGATPWTATDDTRWSVVLRPLLPHESGCEDLLVG